MKALSCQMPTLVKWPQSTIYFPPKRTSCCGVVRDCCCVLTVHLENLFSYRQYCMTSTDTLKARSRSTLYYNAFSIHDSTQQPFSYLISVCTLGIQSLQSPRMFNDEKASTCTLKPGCLIIVLVKSLEYQQSVKHCMEPVTYSSLHTLSVWTSLHPPCSPNLCFSLSYC